MKHIELKDGKALQVKTSCGTVTLDCSHFNYVDLRVNEDTDPQWIGTLTTRGYLYPVARREGAVNKVEFRRVGEKGKQ